MNKKAIIEKIVNDLPLSSELGELTNDEWYGWFEECWDKAINYSQCSTELLFNTNEIVDRINEQTVLDGETFRNYFDKK